MIFQHHRFQVWNAVQHPYVHSLSDFLYNNESLPEDVTTVESALDYILAVLYPQSKPAVATAADLPLVGNSINDFRVVQDDGDGKAAGYRWEQREGDVSAKWYKIYDLDWGTDSILQGFLTKTQDLYVKRLGYDDLDENGAAVVGTLAGQSLYGGASANTNLTLFANSGDGTGAATGYVQFGDNVRPTADSAVSLGTTSERFLKGWFDEGQFGTLNVQGGLVTDSSGDISFGDENLSTTGSLSSSTLDVSTSADIGTLALSGGSITDSSGSISFGDEALTTTGTFTSGTITVSSALVLASGSITDASGAISFGDENLSTTGTLQAGDATLTRADVDNVRVNANSISITNSNGNLSIAANGTGTVDISSTLTTFNVNSTGTVTVTGQLNADNLRLDANTLSSTNTDGDITLSPNGAGLVGFAKGAYPTTDSSFDLGKSGNVWNKLWIDGSIGGATEILVTELLALRNVLFRDSARTQAVQAGDSLFYDAVSQTWLASAPDSEITHSTLSGLTTGDSGHTQFVMLAGRSGGQSIQGGTAASENLNLESTSHGTKGFIQFKDSLRAFSDAVYSGGWGGADIGGVSNRFRHIYTAGEFFGLRLENVAVNPSASTENVGRLVYNTADADVYVDTGTEFKRITINRYEEDTVWDGVATTKDVTVSDVDARRAIWQLKDNTNDFEVIYCSIKATSATNVRITVGSALPAGSYRLVGLE